MKKTGLFLFSVLLLLSVSAQKVALIPEPVSYTEQAGQFVLPQHVTYSAPMVLQNITNDLKSKLTALGFKTSMSTSGNANIRLTLNANKNDKLGTEGYLLRVSPKGVEITANEAAGLFYGLQTFYQFLPPAPAQGRVENLNWPIGSVLITDYPRFGWRGLMFDVSRHFFSVSDVKKYIDQMAKYKFNLLHLHLTDDQGWRIEIKSLPKLTEVGAWNVKKVGYFNTFSPPANDEPRDFGGFYTQNDLKELIRYAQEKYINILPEIDVPGHSLAAVAAYPDLSCTADSGRFKVNSGEPFMDWSQGQPPIALVDNTLCPANEKVYEFLDKVITEVAQIFPFPYIHMGGDECPKNYWEQSAAVKELMQKEGLKNMHEVQSYFSKRVASIVESKGKKFLGWDEIMEGGLSPNAVVMSWQGMKGGIEAAKMGHEVVMSPTTFAYIDYMQGDPIIEPRVYASLRLNKCYTFEPVPDDVDPKFILGAQANLWTEQVYNMRHAEYMTWPRAFAISETAWSPKEKKDWNRFYKKVENHFERFDVEQVKYAPSMFDPIFQASKDKNGNLLITMSTEIPDLKIHYSFDNSFPDQFYPSYTQPLSPPKDAVMLKVITYRGDEVKGRMISMPISEMLRRADNTED